jgi:hypothetical protein
MITVNFDINVGRAPLERNLDVTSAMWNLGTTSAFTLGQKKTREIIDRVGRSQDLLDTN